MSQLKAEAAKVALESSNLFWDVLATLGGAIAIIVIAKIVTPSFLPFSSEVPYVLGGIAGAIIWRRARRDNV